MKLTVKTVLLVGTVVAVGSLCPQQNVHLATTALEGQKMKTSISVLEDTNVHWAVQTLCPVMLDITKMRQYSRPAGSVHVDSTAMILMVQSSHMGSTFALKVITVLEEPDMQRNSSALQGHLTTELVWINSLIA